MDRLLRRLACVAALMIVGPACDETSTPPAPFQLLLPAASATGVSIQPTYSWTASIVALSYLLQVSTDPAFGVILIHRPGLTTLSDTPPTTLAPGTNYYWRVFAVRPTGTVLAGGSPGLFTTLALPAGFSLTAPSNAATNVSLSPLLTWTASTGATSYTVQIATDSGFSSLVVDQAGVLTTSFTPLTPLSTSTTYYWQVSAENGAGSRAASSSPRSFTTLPPPPGSFTLTSPADLAPSVSIQPT